MRSKIYQIGGTDYRVCDNGKIYSMKGFEIKTYVNSRGYLCITAGKKRNAFRVHRIIATVFVPNPMGYPEVDHKDGNRLNPSAKNLRWCNHKQNVQFSKERGMYKRNGVGEKNPHAILTATIVKKIRAEYANGLTYRQIADKYGYGYRAVYQAITRRTWKHIA